MSDKDYRPSSSLLGVRARNLYLTYKLASMEAIARRRLLDTEEEEFFSLRASPEEHLQFREYIDEQNEDIIDARDEAHDCIQALLDMGRQYVDDLDNQTTIPQGTLEAFRHVPIIETGDMLDAEEMLMMPRTPAEEVVLGLTDDHGLFHTLGHPLGMRIAAPELHEIIQRQGPSSRNPDTFDGRTPKEARAHLRSLLKTLVNSAFHEETPEEANRILRREIGPKAMKFLDEDSDCESDVSSGYFLPSLGASPCFGNDFGGSDYNFPSEDDLVDHLGCSGYPYGFSGFPYGPGGPYLPYLPPVPPLPMGSLGGGFGGSFGSPFMGPPLGPFAGDSSLYGPPMNPLVREPTRGRYPGRKLFTPPFSRSPSPLLGRGATRPRNGKTTKFDAADAKKRFPRSFTPPFTRSPSPPSGRGATRPRNGKNTKFDAADAKKRFPSSLQDLHAYRPFIRRLSGGRSPPYQPPMTRSGRQAARGPVEAGERRAPRDIQPPSIEVFYRDKDTKMDAEFLKKKLPNSSQETRDKMLATLEKADKRRQERERNGKKTRFDVSYFDIIEASQDESRERIQEIRRQIQKRKQEARKAKLAPTAAEFVPAEGEAGPSNGPGTNVGVKVEDEAEPEAQETVQAQGTGEPADVPLPSPQPDSTYSSAGSAASAERAEAE